VIVNDNDNEHDKNNDKEMKAKMNQPKMVCNDDNVTLRAKLWCSVL